MGKFIKVTPKGENTPRIVLATLKNFYLSQGAKIENPTDEEVYTAEPSERPAKTTTLPAEVEEGLKKLSEENKNLVALAAKHEEALAAKETEIAELKTTIAAQEIALAESEQAIESLRKDLAKATKSAKESKE